MLQRFSVIGVVTEGVSSFLTSETNNVRLVPLILHVVLLRILHNTPRLLEFLLRASRASAWHFDNYNSRLKESDYWRILAVKKYIWAKALATQRKTLHKEQTFIVNGRS